MNCFSSRFTSSTDVPLPFAMRLRRLPLMIWSLRRSSGVIEQMIASTRPICFSSGLFSASSFKLPSPGIIPRMLSSGPIRRIVFSCLRKSSSVNSFFRSFSSSSLRFVLVDRLLGLLDERQHVAHAEHPRNDPIRVKQLEILEPLAAADKRDRDADHGYHRQRRAAARVAIELGQHDAGHADAAVEFAGALDRVLPGHRVRDVEQVRRLHRGLDRLQFVHQLVVDVQPALRCRR